jgi:hypothetical protein
MDTRVNNHTWLNARVHEWFLITRNAIKARPSLKVSHAKYVDTVSDEVVKIDQTRSR